MAKDKILIVDDEPSMREFLEIMLTREGYKVATASDGRDALNMLNKQIYDLIISDIQMPGMGGLELLKSIKDVSPDTEVIMITAYASTETAVEAMKEGAYDYITKPFKVDEIRLIIKKALDKKRLEVENLLLKREFRERYSFGNILGNSPEMLRVYDLIEKIGPTKTNVLIEGESGTGKELAAKAIHHQSPRRDKPFVAITCSAIPDGLMESELFGHMKGSFTGAIANKAGLFEMADEGTVFLDEIGELPLPIQVKLLRVVQERSFRRVGGTEDVAVDVRIVSATNRTLEEEVRKGNFREDLYYRLNVLQIKMPPLRERLSDIPVLAGHFLQKYAKEHGKDVVGITAGAMRILEGYTYPGNVRELENIIERGVALEQGRQLSAESLPKFISEVGKLDAHLTDIPSGGLDLEKAVGEYEKILLLKALDKAGGVKKRAAKLLNISFRSMRYRLEKFGLGGGEELEGEDE
ncbi:MAG: sigma-54 dependent transcriptional regulator [Deltaproteobacteria bacterium]|nr:sigma-54 dependent transcriptional regulator [Deltaproteobacteria bacterium]